MPSVPARSDRAPQVAVLIPCHNEEAAIGKVVRDFAAALPQATIYVYDNNSTDRTIAVAQDAGAVVRREPLQGKGRVVRRMFADIEADYYILVDGDDTYEAGAAPRLLALAMAQSLDMVTGVRISKSKGAYRPGHRIGNTLLTGVVTTIFGRLTRDMLSGYRVFSRRFVKSFPALSHGFETETEFTVHALELRLPIGTLETVYGDRPEGSESKLNTFRDGFRILRLIVRLLKEERPFRFFGGISLVFFVLAMMLGLPVVFEFLRTGMVARFPTAILASAIATIGVLTLMTGIILDSVTHGRREMKRLAYLRFPAPPRSGG